MTVSRRPTVNRKIKICATENTLTCALMIPTCEASHAHMKSSFSKKTLLPVKTNHYFNNASSWPSNGRVIELRVFSAEKFLV